MVVSRIRSFDSNSTYKFHSVFSDDDLKGFKNVGEGSKAHERGTIGQFGRGSQTMYHWTDVPMILSGRVLLILE